MTLVDATTGEIVGRSLSECEAVIEKGMGTFLAVGMALAEIQQNRLYRGQFATFERYCEERWGWKKSQAYRMIEAAKVHEVLSPMGDIAPANERQARALAPLVKADPAAAAKVLDEVAESGPVTAEKIRDAVRDALREPEPAAPQRPTLTALDGGKDEAHEPTVADVIGPHWPSSFANQAAFRRSNATTRLGTLLDAKLVKDNERLMAMVADCPAEYRQQVAWAAEFTAAAWAHFAEIVNNPRPMEAM